MVENQKTQISSEVLAPLPYLVMFCFGEMLHHRSHLVLVDSLGLMCPPFAVGEERQQKALGTRVGLGVRFPAALRSWHPRRPLPLYFLPVKGSSNSVYSARPKHRRVRQNTVPLFP